MVVVAKICLSHIFGVLKSTCRHVGCAFWDGCGTAEKPFIYSFFVRGTSVDKLDDDDDDDDADDEAKNINNVLQYATQ